MRAAFFLNTIGFVVFAAAAALAAQPGSHTRDIQNNIGKAVINLDAVTKRKLRNGMTVLVFEDHSAPVASVNIWVKTGYFNEPDKITGISHLLEHMFFKGTLRRPVGMIQEEVKNVGGYWNAGTIYDHTSYYITVPSSEINKALDIEADALLNSVFEPAELKKEQEVVIQEILRKYDNPSAMAWESMIALAFKKHHIGRWRMGEPEQIRDMDRETLFKYYWENYRPENIVLVVAGDVDSKKILAEIRKLFGPMPKSKLKKHTSPPEPTQTMLRLERRKADIAQAYLIIGFHAPAALSKNEQAVQALSQLLGDGRSSRLFRELKERRALVNSISASYYSLPDVGALYIEAELDPANIRAAEEAVFVEIEKLKQSWPSAAELDKIKTSMEFSFLSGMEDVSEQASTLAYYEALGDHNLLNEYIDKVRAVSGSDVQRAAREFLRIDNASVLEYLPEKTDAPEASAADLKKQLELAVSTVATEQKTAPEDKNATETEPLYNSRRTTPQTEPSVHKLSNGTMVIIQERPRLPIVSAGIYFPGGRSAETPQTAGLTRLMLRSMLKGTSKRNAERIQDDIESLGTSIGTTAGPDYNAFTLSVLTKNLRPAIGILAEIILQPSFPADEIEKERETQISQIKRARDNMYAYPFELARRAAFGDHPYGLSANGYEENVPAITRAQILSAYDAMLGQPGRIISLTGDIDTEAAIGMLEGAFGSMRNEGNTAATASAPRFASGEAAMERKRAQTAQAFAMQAPGANTGDLAAITILRNIASGMGGRLYNEVREKNNLAYTVAAYLELNLNGGLLLNYAATSPENEIKARELMLAEWAKMASGDISGQEFETAKRYTLGIYQIGLQSNASVRDQQAHNILMGRGIEFLEKYIALVKNAGIEDVKKAAAAFSPSGGIAIGAVRAEPQPEKPQ